MGYVNPKGDGTSHTVSCKGEGWHNRCDTYARPL